MELACVWTLSSRVLDMQLSKVNNNIMLHEHEGIFYRQC